MRTTMDLDQIEQLTRQEGEGWGLAHARRLFALVERIGAELPYNRQVLAWAIYLHDWGAFPRYRQPGVDHAMRSRQIAEQEILPQASLPSEWIVVILEAIGRHDYRCPLPPATPEALLLREADGLDFLGAVGIAREFAWGPNNLQIVYERIQSRRAARAGTFTLPAAVRMAAARLDEIDQFLRAMLEESFDSMA
jgi:uncharacterized protein